MDLNFYEKVRLLQKIQHQDELLSVFLRCVNQMPIHIHDGIELIYVIEGNIKIKIGFDSYELRAGDFLLINIFEVHQLEKISNHNKVLFVQFHQTKFNRDVPLFVYDIHFYRHHNKLQVEKIKKLMVQLYIMPESNDSKNDRTMILDEIISICTNYFQMESFDSINKEESPFRSNQVKLERIGNTYRYFYGEFDSRIQLDQVAEREYINKYYISHLIKSGTGSTFQEVLNFVRIDRAEVLLLGTEMTIQEIVTAIGFSSYQYFNQQFKLYYGMTPVAYRKKYQNETYPMKQMQYDISLQSVDEIKAILAQQFQLELDTIDSLYIGCVDKEKIIKLLQENGIIGEFIEYSSNDIKRLVLEFN